MKKQIHLLMLAMSVCLLFVGCSSNEPQNIVGNASQEEIDNYNDLLKQADDEMKADGNDGDVDE